MTLQPAIERHLGRVRNNETAVEDVEALFGAYAREPSYVCMTHAPTENADVRVSEEEGEVLEQPLDEEPDATDARTRRADCA